MISLNIMTDFCSYWWLWWILPFIIGWVLGTAIMKKWRTMYENLVQENRKSKNTFSKTENALSESIKEVKDLKGQLVIQRGRIQELEKALNDK